MSIKLTDNAITKQDIDQVCEWMQTMPQFTKGKKTLEFESKWSSLTQKLYSIHVNSGSSALLLIIYALIISERLRNKKVVVPALGWSADLSPVLQFDLDPIICDCNMQNLSIDTAHLEKIFREQNPSVLILVSVLGLVPDMQEITRLCQQYNVILIEDVCESMGSEYNGKLLGTFGIAGAYSLYYGHHIVCIEGGMISTDDSQLADFLKMIRSHGWDRDLAPAKQRELQKQWKINEFDRLYTFYYPGFNVRSTDLQAFIGLIQLNKYKEIIQKRNQNYLLYDKLVQNSYWKPNIPANNFVSNLGYPIIHPRRNRIAYELMKADVQVRPLIAGSMGKQPFYVREYGTTILPNVSKVDKYGMYVPNHPYLEKEEIKYVCKIINEVINK